MNRDAVRVAQSPGHDGEDQREGDHGGQVRGVRAAGYGQVGQHIVGHIGPDIHLHSSNT